MSDLPALMSDSHFRWRTHEWHLILYSLTVAPERSSRIMSRNCCMTVRKSKIQAMMFIEQISPLGHSYIMECAMQLTRRKTSLWFKTLCQLFFHLQNCMHTSIFILALLLKLMTVYSIFCALEGGEHTEKKVYSPLLYINRHLLILSLWWKSV